MGDHLDWVFVGSASGTNFNGGNATITLPSAIPTDINYVAVTLGTSKATTLTVATSSGAAYTQVVTTIVSSNARFGVFRRIILSTGETSVTVTGTGGSTDSTASIAFILRNESSTTPEDVTATSTTGNSSTPTSPAITVASCGCAIISAIGTQLAGSAPTAPVGYSNSLTVSATDTYDAGVGMAWKATFSTAASTTATWTATAATAWCTATIAVRPEPYTWNSPKEFSKPDTRSVVIVGY